MRKNYRTISGDFKEEKAAKRFTLSATFTHVLRQKYLPLAKQRANQQPHLSFLIAKLQIDSSATSYTEAYS